MISETKVISDFASLETFFPGADSLGLCFLIKLLSKDLERYLELNPKMRPIIEEFEGKIGNYLDRVKPIDPTKN